MTENRRGETLFILTLGLLAALRVFLFSAAFPFSNQVDEHAHIDIVMKYERGGWPTRSVERFDRVTGRFIAAYGSNSFHLHPEDHPAGARKPIHEFSPEEAERRIQKRSAVWPHIQNYEVHSPPVYYCVGSAWLKLGRALGLEDAGLMYHLRFLNVPVVFALVFLAWGFCRWFFPDRSELRLGVPLLVACLPQDLFYSVTNDCLSPLLFGGALVLLLWWLDDDRPDAFSGAVVGLAVAVAFLAKYTNAPLALLFGIACFARMWRGPGRMSAVVASVAAALPVAGYVARNAYYFGDWSATRSKMVYLGYAIRPLEKWLEHPILTPAGMGTYWSGLVETFWRGEFFWHGDRLASTFADSLYVGTTTLFLLAAGVAWLSKAKPKAPAEGVSTRRTHRLLWGAVLLSVAQLAFLSIRFDFPNCKYPSPDHPYFTSGRLVGGMLIPFFVLYVDGIAVLMRRTRRPVFWTMSIVIAMAAVAIVSEVLLTRTIFAHPFNWFHLP